MNPLVILVAILGFLTLGGLGLCRRRRRLRRRAVTQARAKAIAAPAARRRPAAPRKLAQQDAGNRRKQLLQTLKEQDRRQRKASVSLTPGSAGRLERQRHAVLDRQRPVGRGGRPLRLFPPRAGWAALLLGLAAALGLPRWGISFLAQQRTKKFTALLLRRHRHHRARHQVRPAGARLPAGHRPREPGAAGARVPTPGREHLHGHGRRSGP